MEPIELRIETCKFMREEYGPWEYGIVLNCGDGHIIDMQGNIVDNGWNLCVDNNQAMVVIEPAKLNY